MVCGQGGVSDFDRLRSAVGRMGSRDAFLYAFDVLEINGTDLRRGCMPKRQADGTREVVELGESDPDRL